MLFSGEGLFGDGQNFVISPDSLSFNAIGRVQFTPISMTSQDAPYIAPEVFQCPVTTTIGLEKVIICLVVKL